MQHTRYSAVPDREDDVSGILKVHPQTAVLRRVALLLDGLARAAILPFGPKLVHRLMYQADSFGAAAELDTSSWSQLAYPIAIITLLFTMGRSVGTGLAKKYPPTQGKLVPLVARLGGTSLALHLFAFGAGLSTVRWLAWIRLIMGLVSGYLCGITRSTLPEDQVQAVVAEDSDDEMAMEEGSLRSFRSEEPAAQLSKRVEYADTAPGATKVYMAGFAVSILAGGLLYNYLAKSITMQAFTGGHAPLAAVFFVVVVVFSEFILRCIFKLASVFGGSAPGTLSRSGSKSGAMGQLAKQVVSRRVRIALTPNHSMDEDDQDPLRIPEHREMLAMPFSTPPPNRVRRDSARSETSMSEFFDCNSNFSDEVIDLDADPYTGGSSFDDGGPSETDVAIYRQGKVLFPDGSPAYVPQGDCIANIPSNYLDMCSGNLEKAHKMWSATQQWRYEKNIWKIHTVPHPCFKEIKAAYPHFIHGHSKQGFPIIYEQPGKMNLKEFFRTGGEISEMVRHYTFMMEFISNCVVTRDDIRGLNGEGDTSAQFDPSSWGTMVVMDVQGASITSLSGDVLKYLKQAGDINTAHYPLRLKRAFVVNTPFWLAGAFSSIKGILPESVKAELHSANKHIDGLRKLVDDDQIPKEYGGSSPYPLGQHPYEVALQEMVDKAGTYGNTDTEVAFSQEASVGPQEGHFSPNPSTPQNSNKSQRLSHNSPMASPNWRMESPGRDTSANPLRRRTSSYGSQQRIRGFPSTIAEEDSRAGDDSECDGDGGESSIFVIMSVMYTLWCAIQGALEIAVPLWVLSPGILGGLGYAPSRAGIAMFSIALVLLWILRTKVARMVSKMPSKEPMRSFRVGVGSVTVLLALLPLAPYHVTSVARRDSVLIMTSTILFLSCMALASMLGRSAATILHRIAADSFTSLSRVYSSWPVRIYGTDRLISHCETGKFTSRLRLLGEILGIVTLAPLYCWSTAQERPFPFDGSCSFYAASLVTFAIYVTSFSLHLNSAGEFSPHPRDGCADVDTRKCCSFAGEIFAVVVGDMASLFEEDNWSSSPLLGRATKEIALVEKSSENRPAKTVYAPCY